MPIKVPNYNSFCITHFEAEKVYQCVDSSSAFTTTLLLYCPFSQDSSASLQQIAKSILHFGLVVDAHSAQKYYGLFPPMEMDLDSDLDSDSFPDGYIVLCRTFSTGSDMDSDPCTESFLNGYCTHFRDGSPSQGQISIPIPYI